ncbi:MAG TPA: TIGR03013 family XrtA/PEP-CTERM system glycosyltransferase [Rhizomicrobium sp.]|jgi:sugar transferase (PEP-CTERM system associated)
MRRNFGYYVATSSLVIGAVDCLLFVAAYSFVVFRSFPVSSSPALMAVFVTAMGIVALMHSGGLYHGTATLDVKRTLVRLALLTVPIFALAVWATEKLAQYHVVPIYPYRWQWTLALTAIWILSAFSFRVLMRKLIGTEFLTQRIIILGTDEHVTKLGELAALRDARIKIVGRIAPRGSYETQHSEPELSSLALRLRASAIVVAVGAGELPWNVLANCRMSGVPIIDYLDFFEREARRICIDNLRCDWIALSNGFKASGWNYWVRRISDLIVASVGFVAAAPVILLAALAIKLDDGGAVFYRQERIGLNGNAFVLFKFRSMREDAEIDGKPAWATERDIRVTRVGRLLRKLRIDELPQLYNVLKGEMTLIGPRPERPYFVQQFSQTIPFYDFRHSVRPGITGWAQVSFRYGASQDDTKRKLSYDLYYLKNRSLLFDVLILMKTVGVVLRGEGAR